jgi:hypothetical protein
MADGMRGNKGEKDPSYFIPPTCGTSVCSLSVAHGALGSCGGRLNRYPKWGEVDVSELPHLFCVLQDIGGTFRLLSQSAGRTQHVSVDPSGGPGAKHTVMARQSDSSVEEIICTHEPHVSPTQGRHTRIALASHTS